MSVSPLYLEFHDGRISMVTANSSRVVVGFDHLSGYFPTMEPNSYEVRSCRVTMTMERGVRFAANLGLHDRLYVSDGRISADGVEVVLGARLQLEGKCLMQLFLMEGEAITVEGPRIDVRIEEVGPIVSHFRGVL
ncbi:MAG: hypothetical protein SFW67_31820 [Myxococcaceae bacterium]|nr:hypothetical protein [Myxococcaceae bacterium]